MSNLETDPSEVLLAEPPVEGFDLLEPREVPLGGPRAMSVRRTLPQRRRSLIGGWCFLDHYGPDDVRERGGMLVPPHPHTGLQTVSWLFAGEIDHRDSVGTHAFVRPGEINLMTAGYGIQHSEVSTGATTILHGAQLWIALPDSTRHQQPHFEHFVPSPVRIDGAEVRVFIGSLAGASSPVTVYSPLVGAQLDLPAHTTVTLAVRDDFEHGVLVDSGALTVDGHDVPRDNLSFHPVGHHTLTLATGDEVARALLIGGEPLGEQIVMWWNFIGRSHEEVVAYRQAWMEEVISGSNPSGRFGHVDGFDGSPLPAPELPNVRLRPRE